MTTDELFFFNVKQMIELTLLKVKSSLDELEVTHPDRKDYIESMKESREDLRRIKQSWTALTTEYKSLDKQNHELRTENLQMKAMLEEVRKINQNMIDKLNL